MGHVILQDVIKRVNTKEDKDNTNLIYYVGGEHIDSEAIRVTRRGLIAGSTIGPMFYYGFKAGDFLLVSRNPHLKKAGVVNFDGICSEKTFVLATANPSVLLPEYLPFVLQNETFWKYAYQNRHGSTNTFINWSTLAKYEFELPDIETQRKLAKILWAINDTMEAYKKLSSATDELVKSQFMEQFGATEKVPLDQLATIVMGQSPSSDSYNTDGVGVPFYQGSGEFTDKYVGEGMYCTAPTRMAKAGDVLMSVRAPVGTVNITQKDCCIGRGLAAIRSKVSAEYNEYFLYAFRAMADVLNSMGHGSTVLAINKNELHGLLMPNASLPEQMSFVAFAQQSDKSKFELEQSLSELTATYKRIISEQLG